MAASAHNVCQQILNNLRLSNLNFMISETPYSAQILLKKRFLKEVSGPEASFDIAGVESEKVLANENAMLRKELEDLGQIRESNKEIVKILEEKVSKAEAAALNAFENPA